MNRVIMISLFGFLIASISHAQETNSSASEPASLKAYENYDFVPGEKIVLADDFSDDIYSSPSTLFRPSLSIASCAAI